MTVSEENARFWDELCGTGLARSLGIVELTPESLALFDRAYFDLYPYLRPLIDRAGVKDSNVLEIGLGFGSVGQYIAKQSSSYHAVDIAESPVALMRQRLIFQGLPGAQVQRGSALDLPYPDGAFDTVVSSDSLVDGIPGSPVPRVSR